MTHEELQAIKARAEAATWPALVETLRESADLLERFARKKGDEHIVKQMRAAADEIARARTDVPALVAEVERLRGALKDALGTLSSPIAKKILDDHGIEYAENTTPMK